MRTSHSRKYIIILDSEVKHEEIKGDMKISSYFTCFPSYSILKFSGIACLCLEVGQSYGLKFGVEDRCDTLKMGHCGREIASSVLLSAEEVTGYRFGVIYIERSYDLELACLIP